MSAPADSASASISYPAGSLIHFSAADSYSSIFSYSTLNPSLVIVLFFSGQFYPPCQQMISVCELLNKENPLIRFIVIEAEEFPEFSMKFPSLQSIPTFYFIRAGKLMNYTLEGPNPIELNKLIQLSLKPPIIVAQPILINNSNNNNNNNTDNTSNNNTSIENKNNVNELNRELDKLINQSPVQIFIKGTPDNPRCGFTRKLIQLLNELNILYTSYDILSNNHIREGLKIYKNWPTFPQLYINGELIGGLDIINELHSNNELLSQIPSECIKKSLNDRLKELIYSHKIMLFMKGIPESPQCGFSNTAIELLNSYHIPIGSFGSFNIFSNNEIREGLKIYSNWPTYPQLYINGELIGGLDIMKELHESGELKEKIMDAIVDTKTN